MFNLLPGQGLGFTGSKEIAFGLGTPYIVVVVVTTPHYTTDGGTGGTTFTKRDARKYDRIKRIRRDDEEVFEIIVIALRLID